MFAFDINSEVKVIAKDSVYYEEIGKVVRQNSFSGYVSYKVELYMSGKTLTFFDVELEKA